MILWALSLKTIQLKKQKQKQKQKNRKKKPCPYYEKGNSMSKQLTIDL